MTTNVAELWNLPTAELRKRITVLNGETGQDTPTWVFNTVDQKKLIPYLKFLLQKQAEKRDR